ncbi:MULTISPECIES: HD domain-containing protein [unclassified Cyanobium]|uniref:HD domain-containing protein n=1 Tax=unclassified Cyanobium TaxID=2627006 RepID=UPI0020CCF1F5|nr:MULTISPECIES: HD domain-containing protein [unclassified Cyanobium]MCP9860882.1 HD domain-containing protein [Cyanobium sp. Cruz-8H5]MCP9868107.1 HD domain-containing protein [Cyanobium sp. Cruz-8D1]
MTTSPRYAAALGWAEQLHRDQLREGKNVPYLSHVIAVSSLVWEDGGNEDQAIAGLLHDAIEDAGQSHASIAHRFGAAVADIVLDCTDPGKQEADGNPDAWFRWKHRYLASLAHKPDASLLVTAADKAHNAWDRLLDGHRDPTCWQRARAGLEPSVWYFQRLEHELKQRLPDSRSVERLGRAVEGILALPEFLGLLLPGGDPMDWALAYEQRLTTLVGTAPSHPQEHAGEAAMAPTASSG